jgi:hypothetical protein
MPTLLALVLLALATPDEPTAPAPACPPHLFVIERSTNANIVVYDARRLASGELDPAQPVDVYWIMKARDGQREALNAFERARAYGSDVEPAGQPDRYRITFRANFGRAFTLGVLDGCPAVTTRISGRQARLTRIFVRTRTRFFFPSVDYLEFFGTDLDDGAPLSEKFRP